MTLNAYKTATESGQWLTVRDAMILLKVSEKTVYNRINKGLYESRDNGKTTEVFLSSEVLQESTETVQNESSQTTEVIQKLTEAEQKLSEKVLELSEKVLKMQEIVSERDQTIANLHSSIQRKFLPAVSEPVKQDSDVLARLEQLEALLTASRRPWWKFWE